MRTIFISALALVMGVANMSAQYFSTTKGQEFIFKSQNLEEKTEQAQKSTVISVETAADGVITSVYEEVTADPNNPLVEIKNNRVYAYTPSTQTTKVTVMSSADLKAILMNALRQSADAAGQHMSEMEFNELANAVNAKGDLEFEFNPDMAEGTKLAKSTIRLNAGMMTMRANLWEGKFLGKESVTVPSGTYECLKISYQLVLNTPNGNQKQYITEWYAKDLGLVKSAETDKKGNIISEDILLSVK